MTKANKPNLGDLLSEVGQDRTTEKPSKWEERYKRATFHLPIETLNRLDTIAKQTGTSKAKLVNQALTEFLSKP